jgi:DNA mismatch repair protein MutS
MSQAPPTPPASATPAMRQYLDAKRQYRDAVVFFRMGDFYEMFYEDALTAARALDLTLTSRSKDASGSAIPMCGVPYHAADGYIARLVRKGHRVAVCEQVEDPRKAKGLVRREVVRVVSPGTLTDAAYLDAREPAFILALATAGAPAALGTALLDLSTGEFTAAEYGGEAGALALAEEVGVLRPREILVTARADLAAALPAVARLGIPVTEVEPWSFGLDRARQALADQFGTAGLAGFGLEGHPAAIAAAGALLLHVRDTQRVDLAHVRSIVYRDRSDGLVLDATTLAHLEIVEGAGGGREGSLLHHLDCTQTALGARLLRAWLLRPLGRAEPIQDRLDAVEEFAFRTAERGRLRETLQAVLDLERLVSRAALGTAGPRDLASLRQSIAALPRLRAVLSVFEAPLVRSLLGELDDLADLREDLGASLVDEPPYLARDGGAIRPGVDAELDEVRSVSQGGRLRIAEMEQAERARTGVSSLKIRYNRVFGYYIEVSKANLHAVPEDYRRKQTVAGAERYTTPSLEDFEERVVGADERILEREVELFDALRARVAAQSVRVQDSARVVAAIDALSSLAEAAALFNYTKPVVHEGDEFVVADGRHPVVERHTRDAFVPNDLTLNATTHQLIVLTGPNMGGKSTFLRQAALMAVMAQAGSFVPARHAKLPVVDRLFARVGASDNIVKGQSTFMVEMQETARILHSATSRSLVVLDEIGRGTATFDGLSIAWAVAEHLATDARARPKTLFATHYHELTDIADALPGVANYHVAVREWRDEIVFLRKVAPGRSDRSYGIQVARLAGLPRGVVDRAREILQALERDELVRGGRPSISRTDHEPQQQLGLFQAPDAAAERLAERLRGLDVDHLTPVAALTLLSELKAELA